MGFDFNTWGGTWLRSWADSWGKLFEETPTPGHDRKPEEFFEEELLLLLYAAKY